MYAVTALTLLATVAASPINKRNNSPPPYVQKNLGLQGQDYEMYAIYSKSRAQQLTAASTSPETSSRWGLNNFTDDDFSQAGYEGFRQYVELFRDQEIAHFTALNDALGGGFENCTYTFPVSNPYEFISVAQVVTTVGEGAFIGASGLLSNPDARQTGAEIIGNEARQNSYLRQTINLDYFNAVNFDTPLTASQAYSLAKAFLSCPSSNPPISFHSIPPLTAAFTKPDGPHSAGDEISVMWDSGSVYLGDDVFITFLSDKYSIKADLKQSGGGMGTTYLPAGINGTAFLSATNYQGEAPIPDEQNFAIGYLVVA